METTGLRLICKGLEGSDSPILTAVPLSAKNSRREWSPVKISPGRKIGA